jgi:SSS family transporter
MLFAATSLSDSYSLRGVDLAVVLVYLATVLAVGVWVGRGQQSTLQYFLGDRNLPWWAVLLSIVATETSTVTFLSIPGMTFAAGGDFRFLQITFGYMVGRLLVSAVLLPLYFRGEPFTAYEVLERRFGRASRRATSLLFLVMRNLADGLRLYLSALVLREAMGLPLGTSIVVMGAVTILYTYMGGVKSVIWNDCLQFVIYVVGAVVALGTMIAALPGGISQLVQFADAEGKLRLLDFDPSLVKPTMTFWAGLIGGVFLTGTTHGIDQLTVQRLLAARSQQAARLALVTSGVIVALQFALFLTIGAALAAFYDQFPPETPFADTDNDRVFAHYIVHHLPVGLVGLTLAAVFSAAMSTVSGSLNSSATVLVKDVVAPLWPHAIPEKSLVRLARWATAVFGVVQIAVAILSDRYGVQTSVVNQVLSIAAFASGPMLGLYLLGVLTRVTEAPALAGFLGGIAMLAVVALKTSVSWPWYAALGCFFTVATGLLVDLLIGKKRSVAAILLAAGFIACSAVASAEVPTVSPESLSLDGAQLARIDGLVAREIAKGQLPGCVVVVGRTGGVGFMKAYGERRVEPSPEPMTVDTVFDMASVTKPVATATSVMILVERGLLRLREPVAATIPEFAAGGKDLITVEQLLTHQTGLIPDNPLSDYVDGPEKAWERIFALAPETPPGSKFVYSDVNYLVLGELVRRVTGQSVAEFAAENVFRPLGMNDSGYNPDERLRARAATTEKRDGEWLRGVVHDPRAALLGGVAGHAGLFSTAADLSIYADAMLRRLSEDRPAASIMSRAAAEEMIQPRDIAGELRALGWDIRTSYSKNRGDLMSSRAFGHGGFTGTSFWMDPERDLFVVFLSTRLHPDGVGEVNWLAGRIGAIAAAAIQGPNPRATFESSANDAAKTEDDANSGDVLCGVDVLVRDDFKQLAGLRVGLITNHTGLTRDGRRTIDVLAKAPSVKLVAIFSPEHGLEGKLDRDGIADGRDEATGLPIYSLYGETRRPTEAHLGNLDALAFDIQDIGARYYTYPSTMGLAMEEAARRGKRFFVLDRPNPLGGACGGPMLDAGRESFVSFLPLPVRHGMTVGELARMYRREKNLGELELSIIPVENWRRSQWWDATGLEWVNPSPNIRNLTEALLYCGVGFLETTNLSVGRGTDAPFEQFGAPWIDARKLATELNSRQVPGVRFVPVRFTPVSSKFAGEACQGVQIEVTDRRQLEPTAMGLEIAAALVKLHPDKWDCQAMSRLLGNRTVVEALAKGSDAESVQPGIDAALEEFQARRRQDLLYLE